jgi:multidrug efflux pump subunit AcrB
MSEQSLHLSVRERFNISRIAIQHPWLTLGFWIAVMVAGILAFSSLKYALFPDITFPVVVVNAEAPIATATDTESSLTDVIERGLQSLKNQGLDEIESSTFPGRTIVNLSFQVGTDLNESTDRVSTLVKQLTLPAATTFTVTPVNLNEASVISYALVSTKQSLAQLTQTAQNRVVPAIAQVREFSR